MVISTWEQVLRILLSGVLSSIIGFERESHGREAGLRTMVLVGVGVTTILISSFNVYSIFSDINSPILRVEPARIAYGVVTGIGFLGAGAIIKDNRRIRGLTTAACLWVVTSIGLAVGCGLYLISVLTTFYTLFVLYLLKRIEYKILPDLYNTLKVVIQDYEGILEELKNLLETFKMKILSISIEKDLENKVATFTFTLRYKEKKYSEELIKNLSQNENIRKIIWE